MFFSLYFFFFLFFFNDTATTEIYTLSLHDALPIQTRYLFSAAMSVRPDKEALFNEVYDKEHVPSLLGVRGVIAVARFKSEPVTMMIGGERKTIVIESEPAYTALYEVESRAVLTSNAWAKAVEEGRWAEHVRPYTTNRRHVMYHRIS